MTHRFNCLPTPGGMHFLRSFASFFTSVFVCRRFGRVIIRRSGTSSLRSQQQQSVESDDSMLPHPPESTTTNKSWSFLDEVLASTATPTTRSPSVASGENNSFDVLFQNSITTPTTTSSAASSSVTTPERVFTDSGNFPAIVLTTPTGHRHIKHRQIEAQLQASNNNNNSNNQAQASRDLERNNQNNNTQANTTKSGRVRRRNLFSKRRMFKISDLCSSPTNESSFDYDSCDETGDFDPFDFTSASGNRALTPDGRRRPSTQLSGTEKLKVTEKELVYLNHKIEKLLIKLDEEYETEMASSPDEECVICISAKATMQTYPCGHRVVCRRCFVKTIQMVVSQRMLPLRCVICRSRVLRLRQTSSGGFNTGHVRSHKTTIITSNTNNSNITNTNNDFSFSQTSLHHHPQHHLYNHSNSSTQSVALSQDLSPTTPTQASTPTQTTHSLYRAPSATWSSNLANQTGFLCTGNTRCRSTSPASYKRRLPLTSNQSAHGQRQFLLRLGQAPSPNYCR